MNNRSERSEFQGVPSAELKKQIRGIKAELIEIEAEGFYYDPDTGEECFEVGAEYLLSDLEERLLKLKRELAARIIRPNYTVYGYVATPSLLQMLCLHFIGTYSDHAKNIASLKEIDVIDDTGVITELSPYFEQKVADGYWSDDYFEIKSIEIYAATGDDALRCILQAGHHWIYWPNVEPFYADDDDDSPTAPYGAVSDDDCWDEDDLPGFPWGVVDPYEIYGDPNNDRGLNSLFGYCPSCEQPITIANRSNEDKFLCAQCGKEYTHADLIWPKEDKEDEFIEQIRQQYFEEAGGSPSTNQPTNQLTNQDTPND